MEIDNIKQLTVDHGAAAVGNLARQVERLVLATLRRDDLVTSLGRSRFLVVFPNLDGTSAAAMLEELRVRLEATEFVHDGVKLRTSMTAAVAQAISSESVDKFLSRAAAALADARNAGRNCVAWHDGARLEIIETSSTRQ
jgi:diguanylate cyclase (GGDEF)-like protein